MRRALLIAVLLSLTTSAHGQSLGEAARREQEKKKQTPAAPAHVYTEDDLRSGTKGQSSASQPDGSASKPTITGSPTPSSSGQPSPSPEPDRALLEREWRARFAEARARIAAADARAYEDRIEVVFHSGIPVQERVRVKVETPELIAARQALEDLEEELRRSGGLPGWGRE